MNTNDIKRHLAEIAEMDWLEHDNALDSLLDECANAGVSMTKRNLERSLKRMIKHRDADERQDAAQQATDILNEEFFVLIIGSKFRVGHWVEQPMRLKKNATGDMKTRKVLSLLTKTDFLALVENITVATPEGLVPAGPLWMASPDRRQYRGTVMRPTGEVPDGFLNLWMGWGVEPKEGPCDLILDHIRDVICNGDDALNEYTLNFIAAKIQDPARVMGVMPAFLGGQGTGKGIIFDDLLAQRIFNQHAVVIEESGHLLGKFNKHLMSACYVFADECFFVGDKKANQKMKRRITAKTMLLEAKGLDGETTPSYLGIIAATNESHAVHVEHDDRRVVVGRTSDGRKRDYDYFEHLSDHIEGDGAAHFLQKMLNRDVSDWNPERDRPLTAETISQKERSLKGVHRWWMEVVHSGEFPVEGYAFEGGFGGKVPDWQKEPIRISRKKVRDAYQKWALSHAGERYSDHGFKAFWNALAEIADFGEPEGSNSDQKSIFSELPKQIIKLNAFLGLPNEF
ncbi:primase-helicase family protein [Ruegeria sp. HKCCA5491]|uniref:primase-helicase family protein n=1 Tax=Ruegeria sp. HKCCA5491 TaxID=2682986 RepID=UPI001487A271|nr:primase-helicase family protein [Ruegeria sp. HKCCA5491]